MKKFVLKKIAVATTAAVLLGPVQSLFACTSLLYTDANGAHYAGRTLELPLEMPYQVRFTPQNTTFGSEAAHHHALDFKSKYAFLSINVPDPLNKELKVVDGMNEKGLNFGMLAYATTDGPADHFQTNQAVLAAIDLGAWTLAQFATVAEVKEALETQPVLVTALLPLGLMKTPFHYTLHDATGASIVVEFSNGQQHVYDNPVGVMTNSPSLPWHLTNLGNYTYLNNMDKSTAEFNGQHFSQPDSGIATEGLPSSNTSVGRFVRAVYYSQFTEKVKTPEKAVNTLAHIMNNFDRPRGATVYSRIGASAMDMLAPSVGDNPDHISEYTSWITLSDLQQGHYYVRTYADLNYGRLDLAPLIKNGKTKQIALDKLDHTKGLDLTEQLLQAS